MRAALFLCLIVVVVACNGDEPTISLSQNEIPTVINVVQGDFMTDNGLKLLLSCSTDKNYDCVNYQISTDQNLDTDKVTIDFIKVEKTGDCVSTSAGPAQVSIDLSGLKNGVYPIALNNASLKNNGTLTINDEEVILDFENPRGINIPAKSIRRTPASTYWGLVGYETQNEDKALEFFDKVKALNGTVGLNNQAPGTYTYYIIGDDRKVKYDPKATTYHSSMGIIFQYKGDNEKDFYDQVNALAASYQGLIDVYILSTSLGPILNL